MLDRAYQLAETLIARLERVIELLERLLDDDEERDRVAALVGRDGGRAR